MTTTFNTSCPEDFKERLDKHFSDGRNRSAFIVKVVTEALDRMDERNLWLKTVVTPQIEKAIGKYDESTLVSILVSDRKRNDIRLNLEKHDMDVTDQEVRAIIQGRINDR